MEQPGYLLQDNVKILARLRKLRHRITVDRQNGRSNGAGYDKVSVAVDDDTRPDSVDELVGEQKPTVIGLLFRAIACLNDQGIHCRRLLSYNGPAYVSKAFVKACRTLGLRRICTRPYTTRPNGTAEWFVQTLCREWAYTMAYPNPGSAIAGRPAIW
jgi:hypothetical protein